jgi:predicted aconitase with swiveling domain
MTHKFELHGRIISKGVAEGEALVTKKALSFMASSIANDTGIIRIHGHKLEGKCVKDKVVVYDTDQFSTGASLSFYTKHKIYNTSPVAVICREMHNIIGGAVIYCGVPAMDRIQEGNPWDLIQNGDWVKVDADRGVIEITRK